MEDRMSLFRIVTIYTQVSVTGNALLTSTVQKERQGNTRALKHLPSWNPLRGFSTFYRPGPLTKKIIGDTT